MRDIIKAVPVKGSDCRYMQKAIDIDNLEDWINTTQDTLSMMTEEITSMRERLNILEGRPEKPASLDESITTTEEQTQSVTLPRSDAYFVLDTLQKATNVYSSLLMQEAVNDTLRTILLRDSACVELSIDILKAILPDTL